MTRICLLSSHFTLGCQLVRLGHLTLARQASRSFQPPIVTFKSQLLNQRLPRSSYYVYSGCLLGEEIDACTVSSQGSTRYSVEYYSIMLARLIINLELTSNTHFGGYQGRAAQVPKPLVEPNSRMVRQLSHFSRALVLKVSLGTQVCGECYCSGANLGRQEIL